MKQTIEMYLNEFSRRSVADMCDNMKVHEAPLLMQHVNNAADIWDRSEEWDMDRRNAWLTQREKALAIATRHFGIKATFCKGTDGQALSAIHCYAADGMPNAVINIPGEVTA